MYEMIILLLLYFTPDLCRLEYKYIRIYFYNLNLIDWFSQVRTDFERIEETKLMITIPSAESVNYICVFLTGLIPFPEGTAGFGKKLKYNHLI